MTRIWTVPFTELDDHRLLAQHREWHIITGSILKGRKWKGWEAPEYRQHWIQLHHDLMYEFAIRGFKQTLHAMLFVDLWRQPGPCVDQQRKIPTVQELTIDRFDLWARWGGAFRGRKMVNARAWRLTQRVYEAQGGCTHDGPVFELPGKGSLCGRCKQAFKANDTDGWIPIDYLSDEARHIHVVIRPEIADAPERTQTVTK